MKEKIRSEPHLQPGVHDTAGVMTALHDLEAADVSGLGDGGRANLRPLGAP